ncbi:MAG TPA: hypothetical protein VF862_11225 [Gemmatimonadales bacterium]
MTLTGALPFFLKRSEDVITSGTITSTAETVHGLLRLEGEQLVVQWRIARSTDHVGSEIRTDREVSPVHEAVIPLAALGGGRVRASWWPWSAGRIILTAADLRAFETVAGATGLRLDHPAELVFRVRRADLEAAREFLGELDMALADRALRAAQEPPPPLPPVS